MRDAKAWVVTRKPVSVCGSALRPEAMAAGGVMSVEILLKKLRQATEPLKGQKVIIEGLGNAGKHVATTMLKKGASIVGVSDSKGALVSPDGFTREQLAVIIAHKNLGKRLDTLLSSPAGRGLTQSESAPLTFSPRPEKLHDVAADVLVLAAIPGTIHAGNARCVQVQVVCELTGADVTGEAKDILAARGVRVIPDNLASSGGLLVSLSEMLQNSAGQNWSRDLEERNLYAQLSRSFDAAFAASVQFNVDLPTASDIVALQRMHALAIYRERLEHAALALRERILGIGPDDRVLIVSDDDEDGVASAAIVHTLITHLNPGPGSRIRLLNSSPREERFALQARSLVNGAPPRHIFVLDRALPWNGPARERLDELAREAQLTVINNPVMPEEVFEQCGAAALVPAPGNTWDSSQMLFISPQTLRSKRSVHESSTALILRELAIELNVGPSVINRVNWQAAVGTCLDAPHEPSSQWVWFFTQFNPDRTLEAAHAVRLITRAGGFHNAVQALVDIQQPEHLEAHPAWQQFLSEFRLLSERVQVLVEKIIVENRGRAFVSHLFTSNEVSSPTAVAGNESNELELYAWISEELTRRGNLSQVPIIVGQVIAQAAGGRALAVRIRSPRGVQLLNNGLPEAFCSGGLPNTAVATIALDDQCTPERQFERLVEQIWRKAQLPPLQNSDADGC
jgi:hypothetical protein